VSDQQKDQSGRRPEHRIPTLATPPFYSRHATTHMGGKKKSSLQTALLNQQSRLKQKALIVQAAKSSEKTRAPKKGNGKKAVTIPFAPTDKILLIGEGNFSFACALAVNPPEQLQHLPPQNVTATSYDTEDECLAKYADAREKIDALRAKGVNVIFGVDATKLEKVSRLRGKRWNRVIWNFPHAGGALLPSADKNQVVERLLGKGISNQDRNILSNQLLILGFLRSVSGFLASGPPPTLASQKKGKAREEGGGSDVDSEEEGEPNNQTIPPRGSVIITLRSVPPYTECNESFFRAGGPR
jgi:25S rRNA (uracil2634-N3)-methyltransferase